MNAKYFLKKRRKGAVLVLATILLFVMFAFLAFTVDIGYLNMARTQMQRTADSAAIASAWSLLDGEILTGQINSTYAATSARNTADQYADLNKVLNSQPLLAESDVVVGYLVNPFNPGVPINPSGNPGYNAVQVRVRRTTDQNGAVPLFFARVLGIDQKGSQAVATAAFLNNVSGFQPPSDGSNLSVLPFALDEQSWNELMAGQGDDNWRYDPETKQVTRGPDGIKEVNMFPQGTGSPGNRGTVDIGNPNNSTADIARQILHGITPQDLSYIGGKLALNADGVLFLNGDTGISAGVKDELAQIKGLPRTIPIFRSVSGQGNNAQYTLVHFVGVRIMEVQLTGKMSGKRVIVQQAPVFATGVIPSTSGQTSTNVYTPVCLVR